ncbi:MAG: hypothetical protein ACJAU6_003081 [Alphaproteobacteria bacterium]
MPSNQSETGRRLPKISGRSIVKILVASLLVGIILAALDIDPRNLLTSAQVAFEKLADMGVSFFNWAFTYILIGAVVVVPIWLITYLWRVVRNKS